MSLQDSPRNLSLKPHVLKREATTKRILLGKVLTTLGFLPLLKAFTKLGDFSLEL